MNNPNPFIPQGTLLDQNNKKRARFKYTMLAIFAVNILLVGPLLLNGGCRRGDTSSNDSNSQDNSQTQTAATPDLTSNNPAMAMTSTVPASNPVVAIQPQVIQQPVSAIAPPPAAETEYTVVRGDTLAKIATDKHVKLKDLQAANPSVDPKKLSIGMKLKIPAAAEATTATATVAADSGDTYTVKTGDTLTKIATSHHTTVKELMALNSLKTTAIKVNQKLKLPAGTATTSAPVEPLPTPAAPTTTASNPSAATPVIR